ncbi:anaerobic C4-dicarboxylate transporter family protein [Cardinium endosymbiont of Bemisia tabaci]|uniref:anaerobic C4-dicarboxylate transporter family protein n=1 Tax=Cardinium endosymbiont of Bemisia tabaci TaxID=672794 RepID=UPI000442D30F|nr:anaerobic C4-dicarboxylate transporter family protein [Cardinium endosymbiont of Bemisia tabaci]CDG49789.1 Anaerobic C4-dicarboxylate transporter [Cardinium endosymbiont cBtQ1 of Bemisia tabaci]
MLLIGLSILLIASFLGARLQGLSLSMLGGLGVGLFMVVSNATPADPPFQITLCIASVVAAVGTIEAAGGLSYLVQLAESCIRKHPRSILYISPIVTYVITFFGGTNHIAYSILPVIAEVSKEIGIRPERPLSLSVIAALHGALASPISAIMVILSGFLSASAINLVTILKVIIPSTMGGVLMATWVTSLLSKAMPASSMVGTKATAPSLPPTVVARSANRAKLSIGCFLLGSLTIVLLDAIQSLRPSWEVNGVKVLLPSAYIMPLVMLSTAAFIMLLCGISPKSITEGKAFSAGIQGMLALLGVAWLSSTFVENNKPILLHLISSYFGKPWQFFIILVFMAAIMGSSAATIKAVFPLGIALGIPPKILLASAAAVNGVFIIPIYPTMLAAIHLDTTGSTRVGKFLFNHSFMLPGLVSLAGAIGIGFLMVYIGVAGL